MSLVYKAIQSYRNTGCVTLFKTKRQEKLDDLEEMAKKLGKTLQNKQ